MDDTKYWLWLSMIFGTGSRRIWEAMNHFESAYEAYCELSSGYLSDRLDDQELRNIKNTDIGKAENFIRHCEKSGIGVVGYSDSEYPPQLRHIYNPPVILYYKGNISCLTDTMTITAVGARRASSYSVRAAEHICRELAVNGAVIISGFAIGIDIASHLAAVSVNRPTACIMGCGVDVDYPRENFRYRKEIIANGGVLVSEFPPGTPPYSPNFPKRNRILSGLSRATLVFEASLKSGSLITAGLALEQGRDVFCLPPANIFSESYSGNIAFLRDGAYALYSADDVIECFGTDEFFDDSDTYTGKGTFGIGELSVKKQRAYEQPVQKEKPIKNSAAEALEKDTLPEMPADEAQTVKSVSSNEMFETLTPVQKSIAELLSGCSLHADVLVQKLGIDSAELMTELTELEILGIIKSLPGKMFEISV